MATTVQQPLTTEHPAIGVLISNLGTPDAPTGPALRRYLKEFLWDPRVVELPRWLWWMILNGIVLRVRPSRSAHAYNKIWTDEGSPLLLNSRRQQAALETELRLRLGLDIAVALGMRYGTPSIAGALDELKGKGVQQLLVLPLYPQYSAATTASTFDCVARVLKTWRYIPKVQMVNHYYDHPAYIRAVANSIWAHWNRFDRPQRLLFSFHGMPKKTLEAGDPYYRECQRTAALIMQALNVSDQQWHVAFQSRFGYAEWLKPYTIDTLKEWGRAGVRSVDVICPGFSADCLETLEEIAMQNREVFLSAGGEIYHYIPALNDQPDHIRSLADLVVQHIGGWLKHRAAADGADQARSNVADATVSDGY
jgi:ferrochelatase